MNHTDRIVAFRLALVVLCGISAISISVACADIRLPSVIGDNMVLQADDRISIWGWADPNEDVEVSVSWRDGQWTLPGDESGQWRFVMTAPESAGPHEITLRGKNTVTIKNILIGEVWVCSGQSNMEWPVQSSANAAQEIAAANYPKIRLFTVQKTIAETPQADCTGRWVQCSPETVPGFSAVGYFFGRHLHRETDTPIGLINASWGGTVAEAWTSADALKTMPDFAARMEAMAQTKVDPESSLKKYQSELPQWQKKVAPTVLYNGMIAPITRYPIRGTIWYQGEANANRAYQYRELFPTMIRCWWDSWDQRDFSFLFVQLANYMAAKPQPSESAWAELREAQLMTLQLPNTGMATTIDIGEADDIHPRNKQDVGKRLALWALANTYGKDITYSGPLYESMTIKGNRIVLRFTHADDGLVTTGGEPLKGFAIAGADRQFVWAEARIEGDTVVVSSDKVSAPVAVRYAWADNPVCNLYNGAGLPASPFRTDTWPGMTTNNR